jgi:tight adherence protein B
MSAVAQAMGAWPLAVPALLAMLAVATGSVLFARAGAWGTRLQERRLTHLSQVELAELFVFIEPARLVRLNLLALALLPAMLGVTTGSPLPAGIAFVAVLVLPTLAYRRLRRRRLRALQRQLPDAIASVAAALRGGAGLWQALEGVPRHQPRPVSQEVALVLRQHRLGMPLEEALQGFAARSGLHDIRMLVATLAIARDLGGGLAEVLERLSQSVRRRVAMEDRIEALTAQGRMQGRIVGALPLLLGAVLFAMEPGPMGRLFSTPAGWLVLALVAALELVGAWLIRRIVRIDV